jgi:hypothetical protein
MSSSYSGDKEIDGLRVIKASVESMNELVREVKKDLSELDARVATVGVVNERWGAFYGVTGSGDDENENSGRQGGVSGSERRDSVV